MADKWDACHRCMHMCDDDGNDDNEDDNEDNSDTYTHTYKHIHDDDDYSNAHNSDDTRCIPAWIRIRTFIHKHTHICTRIVIAYMPTAELQTCMYEGMHQHTCRFTHSCIYPSVLKYIFVRQCIRIRITLYSYAHVLPDDIVSRAHTRRARTVRLIKSAGPLWQPANR